jgi:hypothetical protein
MITLGSSRGQLGLDGERFAELALKTRGMKVKRMPYKSPFDLLADGKRIEVKTATKRRTTFEWLVNFHRHGKLKESGVDAYVILLDMRHLGKKKPLILICPAPVGRLTRVYSIHSLLTKDHWQIENWSAIGADSKTNQKNRKKLVKSLS